MEKLYWVKRTFGLFLLCATTAIVLPAQTFITLHSFDGTDGVQPEALLQATDGNLYGTTASGGANNNCSGGGCGTVFRITPSGTLTTLYNFCPQINCTDGFEPSGALVQGPDGNFYGTTVRGGNTGGKAAGTVFKITPSGTLTTLYRFGSQSGGTDGVSPVAALVQAADGNFYGTTEYGGVSNNLFGASYGTIFKITPSGTLTTLHSFGSGDGANPVAALVQATDGNFYGTTSQGGASSSCFGFACGTVFKMTPSGVLTTLHSFDSTDGSFPYAGLIQATDGNFYGTTPLGGNLIGCNPSGCGTVFKITPSGTLTTLHSFDVADGASPEAALTQATDGNLYGTTANGGTGCLGFGCGTIFKITRSGTLTTLHSFNVSDGDAPLAALVQDTNGSFYGTTANGADGFGTVFSLSVALGSFVETQTTSGKVGAAVKILGTNLTGATSVTFNGTAATFTVKSSSLIATTVPAGATTGTVQVVTPSGTLSSNVPFRVLP